MVEKPAEALAPAAAATPVAPMHAAASIPATAANASAPTAASRRAAGSSASASDNRAYFAAILQRLNRFKVYPAVLRKEKVEGLVVMQFTIRADGRIVTARVQRSSGSRALDRAAEDMLERANPLPAIPDSLDKASLTLSVPVEYSLLTD